MLLLLPFALRDKVSEFCRAFEAFCAKLCIIDIAVLLLSETKCRNLRHVWYLLLCAKSRILLIHFTSISSGRCCKYLQRKDMGHVRKNRNFCEKKRKCVLTHHNWQRSQPLSMGLAFCKSLWPHHCYPDQIRYWYSNLFQLLACVCDVVSIDELRCYRRKVLTWTIIRGKRGRHLCAWAVACGFAYGYWGGRAPLRLRSTITLPFTH